MTRTETKGHYISAGLLIFVAAALLACLTAIPVALAADAEAPEAPPAGESPKSGQSEQTDPNAPPAPPSPDDKTPADPNQPSAEDEDDSMFPDAEDMSKLFSVFGQIFNDQLITKDGSVDYSTLRRKRGDLIQAAALLESLHPAVLMSLEHNQRIAFWINTYNTCALKLVIDNYPIQPKWYMVLYPNNSIMQIPGAWTKVFFPIMGLEYNLNEIRHDLLLNRYKDPRICFALTDAARGGAMLRNELILPDKLDEQLNDQVRKYLASPTGIRIDRENRVIYLSNVFSMNKKVFLISEYAEILKFRSRKPEERAWLNFLYKFLPEEDAAWLDSADPAIRFIDFDWALNEK